MSDIDAARPAALAGILAAQPTREERLRAIEPTVERWCWSLADPPVTQWRPLQMELAGEPPPMLDERPADGWYSEYGLDADGRIVLARRMSTEDGVPQIAAEQLLEHRDDGTVLAVRYESFGSFWLLVEVALTHVRDGRVVLVESAAGDLYGVDAYTWADGRLVETARTDGERLARGEPPVVEYLIRDEAGRVVELRTEGEGVRWRRDPPVSAWADVVDALTEHVDAAVRAAPLPAAIVLLRHEVGTPTISDAVLPSISIASLDDRLRMIELTRAGDLAAAWDWIDWSLPEVDADLSRDLMELVHGLNAAEPAERAADLLAEVAGRLNERHASAVFVVAEHDVEDHAALLRAQSLEVRRRLGPLAPRDGH